jgi:hypothetical protein
MLFNSYVFIFLFFPITLLIYFRIEQVEIDPGLNPLAHFRISCVLWLVEPQICVVHCWKHSV